MEPFLSVHCQFPFSCHTCTLHLLLEAWPSCFASHLHHIVRAQLLNSLHEACSNELSRLDSAAGVHRCQELGALGVHRQHVQQGPVCGITPAIRAQGAACLLQPLLPGPQALCDALLGIIQQAGAQGVVGRWSVGRRRLLDCLDELAQEGALHCAKGQAFCKNEVSQGPVNSLFVSAGKSLANLVGSSHSSGQEQQKRQQWWSAVAAIMGHAVQFHGNRT